MAARRSAEPRHESTCNNTTEHAAGYWLTTTEQGRRVGMNGYGAVSQGPPGRRPVHPARLTLVFRPELILRCAARVDDNRNDRITR